MSRSDIWRDGEVRVISVTPVSRGVIRPTLFTITTLALIIEAGSRYSFIHRVEDWLILLLVGPLALVTLTRVWKWRSHKVHVTNERVIVEGGVLRHQRTSVEMRDVLSTRIDQRVSERLTRRGYVYLETPVGSILVGLVRHPNALCRLIDAERLAEDEDDFAFDTVFTYEDPEPHQFEVRPDEWQRRRYE
jgi:uncharacterized membrane protein YdbT with pleckstrin-like domain